MNKEIEIKHEYGTDGHINDLAQRINNLKVIIGHDEDDYNIKLNKNQDRLNELTREHWRALCQRGETK